MTLPVAVGSHASVSVSVSAWAFVREGAMLAVMVAVMGAAALAGHGSAPMLGAAFVFAALSFAYAPLARTRAWAREHVVDLWAMVLVMVAQAVAGASGWAGAGGMVGMAGMSGHGLVDPAVTTAATAATAAATAATAATTAATAATTATTITTAVILLAWLIARAVLARRGWRIHSLVSLVGCGACLVWMLLA